MPPKSKRIKKIRTSQENIFVASKATQKSVCKNEKAPRKALSDKTNSASDDNDPIPSTPKLGMRTRKMMRSKNASSTENKEIKVRPNRNQKAKESLSENQVVKLNSNKTTSAKHQTMLQKEVVVILEPLQVCDKVVETNIADSRPKRMRRLPSKFDDHFISPSKCVPVQQINASTPIVRNKDTTVCSVIVSDLVKNRTKRNLKNVNTKAILSESSRDTNSMGESSSSYNSSTEKPKRNIRSTKCKPIRTMMKKPKANKENTVSNKKQADTNNNANDSNHGHNLCYKSPCKEVNKVSMNRIINKDYSFRLFDEQKHVKKRNANNLDVYEFTFDPALEPPPQKRKRKRIIKKKQEKPKPVFKSTYDKNVAKSITALKNRLPKKSETKLQTETLKAQTSQNKPTAKTNDKTKNVSPNANHREENGLQQNFNSFNVEDIVLNDESIPNNYNDINYSPVNSPDHVRQPSEPRNEICSVQGVPTNIDPLNIQDDLSFFDDHPVASSSMNMSARNPSATPWRAEFEQLPIKWQVNTYVKPNMTPALESSFINFDNKKKHVYTNMVPEDNEPLPEIIDTESTSKLKQTSIISFFKEVVERQTNKKSKFKTTPVKVDAALADNQNTSRALPAVELVPSNTINKSITPQKMSTRTTPGPDLSINDKENSPQVAETTSPLNSDAKKCCQSERKNKDITFFGFDESEEQENVSPVKKSDKRRINSLKPLSRAVLQEINLQTGPARLPLGAKNKKDKNANINKVFDQAMENVDQNLFQEKANEIYEETNNANNIIEECHINLSPEDSQSVHLFEDLEIIHHLKPPRKSYTKAKKVAFRQHSESSDTQEGEIQNQRDADSSAEEDNLDDLTFEIPSAQTKRQRKKKKTNNIRAKKEEKEVEEWAAGFNSMCDDIEHFDLIVE